MERCDEQRVVERRRPHKLIARCGEQPQERGIAGLVSTFLAERNLD